MGMTKLADACLGATAVPMLFVLVCGVYLINQDSNSTEGFGNSCLVQSNSHTPRGLLIAMIPT